MNKKPKTREYKMFQYSKVLTTLTLLITMIINLFYFLYIVPQSGMILVTDAAMQYSSAVLKVWNGGTIVFFCGYFAKALFETKFEKDDGYRDKTLAERQIEKMEQKREEVLEETNY